MTAAPLTSDDFTSRYVEAATRSLPADQRHDYAEELTASIRDQIDDRVAAGESPADAEKAVLTAMGDPAVLAAGYADRPLHLIGPRYFSDWKRLLVLLLWIVVPIGAFAGVLGAGLRGDAPGGWVGAGIASALTAGVHVFFWVTLAFALVERFGAPKGKELGVWSVDMLPLTAHRRAQFGEVAMAFVAAVVMAAALAWDRWIAFIPHSQTGGEPLPVLHPDLWPWGFAIAVGTALVTAVLTLLAHLAGRWATWMGLANAILSLAVTAAALVLLANGLLLNAAFVTHAFGDAAPQTVDVLGVILGAGIAVLGAWSAWDSYRRTRSVA
ncbi:permease prefix domain 1-containing protein [Microbacterium sp. NPDC096154]|uniref:permease prefix domain 1-containing protein n=1 Tax=Microbacterium sp. NPDC096154 TaxID=3155549 RepID=UPI00331DA6EA